MVTPAAGFTFASGQSIAYDSGVIARNKLPKGMERKAGVKEDHNDFPERNTKQALRKISKCLFYSGAPGVNRTYRMWAFSPGSQKNAMHMKVARIDTAIR
jgi:hypothetical protein